jgi:hypothetical protein
VTTWVWSSQAPPESGREASAGTGLRPVSEPQGWHDPPDEQDEHANEDAHVTPRCHPLTEHESPARQGVTRPRHVTPIGTLELRTAPTESYQVGPSSSRSYCRLGRCMRSVSNACRPSWREHRVPVRGTRCDRRCSQSHRRRRWLAQSLLASQPPYSPSTATASGASCHSPMSQRRAPRG